MAAGVLLAAFGVAADARHSARTPARDPASRGDASGNAGGNAAPDARVVAVAPFRTGGADPALGYLREGMLDLLAAKLTGDGGPRATEPRTLLGAWARATPAGSADPPADVSLRTAQRLGAGRLLLGSVVGTPRRLVLTASLLTVPGGTVRARGSAEGPQDSLSALVDRLAAQLLVREAGEAEHLAPLTRTPLVALQAYLSAQAAYRRGHFAGAARRFEQALEADSTFALAALGLVTAAWWPEVNEKSPRAAALAWALRDRLSRRDRALLAAYVGRGYPGRATAGGQARTMGEHLDAWQRALAAAPDRAQPWFEVGDILFHWGATLPVQTPRAAAAAAFARVLALDPDHSLALDHRLQLALFEGDTAAVRRDAALYFARDSTGDNAEHLRWHVAHALGDGAAVAAVRARIPHLGADALGSIVGIGMQLAPRHAGMLDDVDRAAAALRALRALPPSPASQMLALYDLNRGRPAAPGRGRSPANVRYQREVWVTDALYWDGDTTPVAGAMRDLVRSAAAPLAAEPRERAQQARDLCIVEQWRLARGQTGATRHAIRTLRGLAAAADSAAADPGTPLCAALLDALLASHERRPDAAAAVDRLDTLTLRDGTYFGRPAAYVHAVNLLVARMRAAQGDVPGALAAVRRRPFQAGWGSLFLSSYLREEARLAARAGDRAGAIRAYRHYLALRRDPAPALRADAARVRAELARLTAAAPAR